MTNEYIDQEKLNFSKGKRVGGGKREGPKIHRGKGPHVLGSNSAFSY